MILTREKVAHLSYKDKEQLDFQILLAENYYVNPANIHICFPIKIKKKSNNSSDTDDNLIPVNNFFAHWVKEISITKYGSDRELPPTFTPWEIYQYSDAMLKHLPKASLKTIQKHLLYSKEPVFYGNTAYERRNFDGTNITRTGLNATQIAALKRNHAKDNNIDDRIELFHDQISEKFVYRIPLRYFSDIGKTNFPTKIDYRIKLFLETNATRLFESRKLLTSTTTTAPAPDAKILFIKAPFIQYEQILLDKNFRQHLETIMVSKKIIRMGAQKAPIQKTYEIKKGSDTLNVEFLGSNRQFDWLEISIMNDKSNNHTTIYDSYNRELITLKKAAQFNIRVRIWAYSLSEYLYVLSKSGLTLKHRTYAINKSDDDFLE